MRFALLDELAWQIAAPSLLADGRGPVPEGADLALLLGVLRQSASRRWSASAHPRDDGARCRASL